MKKLLISLCVVLSVLAASQSANALIFTLDSYNVSLNTADPGLKLYWDPILTTPVSHDFSVGEAIVLYLFKVGTQETWSNNDDKVQKDISVEFKFSAPPVLGTVSGKSWGNAFWIFSWAKVEWNDPVSFYFGDGGLFTIDLGDAFFGTPGCDIVTARLEYVSAPVPEPATMLLLGSGLLGLAGLRRKFKK